MKLGGNLINVERSQQLASMNYYVPYESINPRATQDIATIRNHQDPWTDRHSNAQRYYPCMLDTYSQSNLMEILIQHHRV